MTNHNTTVFMYVILNFNNLLYYMSMDYLKLKTKMLISRVLPILSVHRLPHSWYGCGGHILNLPQDLASFVCQDAHLPWILSLSGEKEYLPLTEISESVDLMSLSAYWPQYVILPLISQLREMPGLPLWCYLHLSSVQLLQYCDTLSDDATSCIFTQRVKCFDLRHNSRGSSRSHWIDTNQQAFKC